MTTETKAAPAETQLAHVDLDDIDISNTNEMFRDDADMENAALKELADSIAGKGIITPILLRPGKKKKYELVCGERRYRASLMVREIMKARKTIPAYIRELDDNTALECQITENLHREGINPMKEAHAFEWMMKNKKFTTEAIARKIGKSIDYVQSRLRLNSLTPKAQKLVRDGILPIKAALMIARAPSPKIQHQALDNVTETIEGKNGKQIIFTGLEQLQEFMDRNVFNELGKAEFDREDAKLVPGAGTCSACVKRTHNVGGLFDDISKSDMCLDGGCFRDKRTAHYKVIQEEVKKKNPEAKVVFKERGYSEAKGLGLGSVLPAYNYESREITEAQAKNDKNAQLAVLVGNDGGKKTQWISTSKPKTEKSKPTPKTPAQKAADKRAKETEAKQEMLAAYKDYFQLQALFKQTPTALRAVLRKAVREYAGADANDETEIMAILFAFLDVPFELKSNYMADAKATEISGTPEQRVEKLANANGGIIRNIEKLVDKIPVDNIVHAFAWICMSASYNTSDVWKAAGLDQKAVNAKAKDATDKWWKAKQTPATPAKKGGNGGK